MKIVVKIVLLGAISIILTWRWRSSIILIHQVKWTISTVTDCCCWLFHVAMVLTSMSNIHWSLCFRAFLCPLSIVIAMERYVHYCLLQNAKKYCKSKVKVAKIAALLGWWLQWWRKALISSIFCFPGVWISGSIDIYRNVTHGGLWRQTWWSGFPAKCPKHFQISRRTHGSSFHILPTLRPSEIGCIWCFKVRIHMVLYCGPCHFPLPWLFFHLCDYTLSMHLCPIVFPSLNSFLWCGSMLFFCWGFLTTN